MPEPVEVVTVPAAAAGAAIPCRNCGTPLLGPHCYKCGQPVDGLVRHFTSIIGDFFDSVFDLDARMLRTVWPLFAKPGYLSREYFEGRRVRYVSPVRLFFFLSIVTFFFAQLSINIDGDNTVRFDKQDSIENATTVAEVVAARDTALRSLAQARSQVPDVPGAHTGIDVGMQKVREKAQRRITQLQHPGSKVEKPKQENTESISFNDKPWDPVTNPVKIGWLPAFANRWINNQVSHGRDNIAELRKNPERLKNAVLGALPSTLFVLLPIFALMLKVTYLFKRRLYMEHLIVALHSHAFLCLALLLVFVASALGDAVPALATPAGWIQGLLFLWMPLYLLLMQKRIYGQGWPMTLLKYLVLGFCYFILMSLGVAATILASLVWA
ncbi:MAG: DUF3667 domain-containing protein [Luteimonas sp.]